MSRFATYVLALAVAWVGWYPTLSQSAHLTNLPEAIDSVLASHHQSGAFNGTALVAEDGKAIYRKSWGLAVAGVELQEEMPFYLGSLAKQFTAVAVLMTVQQQNLSLDQKIAAIFPELPDFTNEISIRHLLNHTSGLPDYYRLGKFVPGMTNEMVLQAMQDIDSLDFPAGNQYDYSNSGYVLLSMLVARVTGQSFNSFVTQNIFGPLGMSHSIVYDGTANSMSFRAIGHNSDGQIDDYNAFTTGGGGIFSQADDLLLWDQALYNSQLLDSASLQAAYSPVKLGSGEWSYYGFGWRLDQDNPHIVQHSGSLAGFRTYFYRNLQKRQTIILLSNFTNDVKTLNEVLVNLMD